MGMVDNLLLGRLLKLFFYFPDARLHIGVYKPGKKIGGVAIYFAEHKNWQVWVQRKQVDIAINEMLNFGKNGNRPAEYL